jgi:hypothetical protein
VSAVEIAEIQPSDTVRLMHTLGPDTYFYANAGQSLFGLMILMLALVPFTMFCLWSDRRAESRYE